MCVCGFVCLWVCYHDNYDNSKLRASIFTKLGLLVKVVTVSSWLNFGRPAPAGRGSVAERKFLAPPYYSQRAVFASLWALFHCQLRFWRHQLVIQTVADLCGRGGPWLPVASPTVRLVCCMITSHRYGSYQRHSFLIRLVLIPFTLCMPA